jgi:hypothetical protein
MQNTVSTTYIVQVKKLTRTCALLIPQVFRIDLTSLTLPLLERIRITIRGSGMSVLARNFYDAGGVRVGDICFEFPVPTRGAARDATNTRGCDRPLSDQGREGASRKANEAFAEAHVGDLLAAHQRVQGPESNVEESRGLGVGQKVVVCHCLGLLREAVESRAAMPTLPTLLNEVSRKSLLAFAGDWVAIAVLNYLAPAIGTTSPGPLEWPLPSRA